MPTFRKSLYDLTALRFAPILDLEVKAGRDGTIAGYASTFDGKADRVGDVVAAGAFRRTLADHKAEGTAPAMLWSHRIDEPIGKWSKIHEDRTGLFVEGQINLKTARGREAFEHVAAGDVEGFSIGYIVPAGGLKQQGDGTTLLTDIDLVEVSIVAVPANPRARITSVKSIGSKSDLADLLREAGLPKAAAARVAAGGWPALAGADHQKAIDLAAEIARATAQLKEGS